MELVGRIRRPFFRVSVDNGVHSALHVYGSHQRYQSLERVLCSRAQLGWLLELDHRLAQSGRLDSLRILE
jgi:hypothetical protein